MSLQSNPGHGISTVKQYALFSLKYTVESQLSMHNIPIHIKPGTRELNFPLSTLHSWDVEEGRVCWRVYRKYGQTLSCFSKCCMVSTRSRVVLRQLKRDATSDLSCTNISVPQQFCCTVLSASYMKVIINKCGSKAKLFRNVRQLQSQVFCDLRLSKDEWFLTFPRTHQQPGLLDP